MAGLADFQIPPPAKWEDFEDLCLDCGRKSGMTRTRRKTAAEGSRKTVWMSSDDREEVRTGPESSVKERMRH
jgi:hypothetical protein